MDLEQGHKPTGEWAEQYGTGEKAQILRLPRGFPGFQIVLPVTEIFIIFILFCRGGGP